MLLTFVIALILRWFMFSIICTCAMASCLVLCMCFVDRCLSFYAFSFGDCVIFSSIYGFWLPLWYLQTRLTYFLLIKWKTNNYHAVELFPKSNRKIVNWRNIDNTYIQMHGRSLSLLCRCISITSVGAKLHACGQDYALDGNATPVTYYRANCVITRNIWRYHRSNQKP